MDTDGDRNAPGKRVNGMFRNKDQKLLLSFALAAILVFSVFLLITLSWTYNGLVSEVIERDTSVIGRLVVSHPELKEDIVAVFSSSLNEECYADGLKAASMLGYTKDFVTETSFLKQNKTKYLTAVIVPCILIFFAFFIFVYILLDSIFKKMALISNGIEKVMDGQININLPEDAEGNTAILCYNVNQLISRMNSLIEKLQREKDFLKSMMSNMSHQIKTSIASLKMFNEILENDGENAEIRKEFTGRNTKLIERIEKLVANLLKYSKMHTGAIKLNMNKGSLTDILTDILDNLHPIFKSRNQYVATEFNNIGESCFDADWMYEALENIIKNASDYTEEGKTIEIATFRDIEGIKIRIKDEGPGISPKDKGRIFEPFYTGHTSSGSKRSNASQHTGIGLALSKIVIVKHNGYITLDTSPGKGSTFTVVLP